MNYLYNVATNKNILVTVRIAENVRDDFKTACELRGASMSSLLHQFIVRTIREEKELSPKSFIGTNVVKSGDRVTKVEPMGEITTQAPKKQKTG